MLTNGQELGSGPPASGRAVRRGRGLWVQLVRVVSTVGDRPLVATGLASGALGLLYGTWVWRHRHLGAYDPDEAGYLATALRYHRSIDFARPFDFVYAVGATGTGPMVPLLAVPLLILGARDPRVVMMVQPALLVIASVAIAGCVTRMVPPERSGGWAAIAGGVGFATLPGVGLSVQSFWLGLGAAASMACALWALLASERLSNRWSWAFGAGLAAMLLSRTMAVAFVPGLLLGAAVLAGRRRESWCRLLQAAAVTLVLAGPWWFVEWPTISQYLFSYGIGPRAALFGSGDVVDRMWFRLERMATDSGQLVARCAAVAVVVGLSVEVRRRRRGVRRLLGREVVAMAIVLLGGFAALLSTSNNGVWFELPLIAVFAVLMGAAAAALFWPARAILLALVLAQAVAVLPVLFWIVPPSRGITAHYEWGFSQYDDRFLPSRRPDHEAAASEWWTVATSVSAEMRRVSPSGRPVSFVVSGNMVLFNSNTLALACELDGWGPRLVIPDTTLGKDERAEALAPRVLVEGSGRLEQVLLLAVHDLTLFTPDRDVEALRKEARALGWEQVERWDLPSGGYVEMLRHRSNLASED